MGTLEKDGSSNPLIFDGKAASWPPFKTAVHKLLDNTGFGCVVEGGNAFCSMLQAAAAQAAKSIKALRLLALYYSTLLLLALYYSTLEGGSLTF